MKYSSLIATLISILLIPLIFKNALKDAQKISSNTIKNPKFYTYISISLLILIAIGYPICVIFSGEDAKMWLIFYPIIFLPIIIPYIFFTLFCINWKLEVFEDYVIYHNLFNKIIIYKFEDVVIKEYSASVRILKPYINKKGEKKNKLLVNISCYSQNYRILQQKYKTYLLQNKSK